MEETGEREFVECSPRDRRFHCQYFEFHFLKRIVFRWGIGLGMNNPKCSNKSKWRGTNWLGECLTNTRLHCRSTTEPSLEEFEKLCK